VNIIYFNPDELRADTLGCYGHPLVKTPNIDRLAARGVLFENAFVQHTVCSPSRCSFLTGQYPHNRGHRSLWHLLQPEEQHTLKYAKSNGYDVHWWGKNDALAEESYAESITCLHHAKDVPPNTAARIHAVDEPGYFSFLYTATDNHTHDYFSCLEAAELIRSRKVEDNPLFLFMTLTLPHCPYTVPEPWYSMYDPADIPPLLEKRIEKAPKYHEWIRLTRQLDECDPEVLKKIMAVYLGMISYLDHIFGFILDAVDESVISDDTAIFFFSDHGDWAGDYGLVEKWPTGLDDLLTKTPLIISTPDCAKGHQVAEPVELNDLVPTTADLGGYELRHTQYGRSLMPQLDGVAGDSERAVFTEGGYNPDTDLVCFESVGGIPGEKGFDRNPGLLKENHIYYPKVKLQEDEPDTVCRAVMIRTPEYKLIRRTDDISELYDLKNDPHELDNLSGEADYREIEAQLNERLLDWYMRTADAPPWGRDYRGHPDL